MMPLSTTVRRSLGRVLDRIDGASQLRKTTGSDLPRLVAVSKKKSVEHIVAAYEYGQRHFGENYAPELGEKARDARILREAPDINWHYIGALNKSHCKYLAAMPCLWMVETVAKDKVASALNRAWGNQKHGSLRPLRVMVQVNTSEESNKNGCLPAECLHVVRHILRNCDSLQFSGLMTIGAVENSQRTAIDKDFVNPDFEVLAELREAVCKSYALCKDQVDLSMGMTADMEHAISMGSTNLRVGTAIFGSREDGIYASESSPDDSLHSPIAGPMLCSA